MKDAMTKGGFVAEPKKHINNLSVCEPQFIWPRGLSMSYVCISRSNTKLLHKQQDVRYSPGSHASTPGIHVEGNKHAAVRDACEPHGRIQGD